MRNPDPLGNRYPVSGPSWQEVVRDCDALTRDGNDAAQERSRAHQQQRVARDRQMFQRGMSPEAIRMQREMDEGFGR